MSKTAESNRLVALGKFNSNRFVTCTGRRLWRLVALRATGIEPRPRIARSASSKRIPRGLNTRASLREDGILSYGFSSITDSKNKKEHSLSVPFCFW